MPWWGRRRVAAEPIRRPRTSKYQMAEHRSFRVTPTPNDESTQQPSRTALGKYVEAITAAVAQQAVVLIFASLIAQKRKICPLSRVAAVASWVCTPMILLRRPKHTTRTDLAIVKFGFWLAIPLVPVIGFVVDLVR